MRCTSEVVVGLGHQTLTIESTHIARVRDIVAIDELPIAGSTSVSVR